MSERLSRAFSELEIEKLRDALEVATNVISSLGAFNSDLLKAIRVAQDGLDQKNARIIALETELASYKNAGDLPTIATLEPDE